MEFSHPEHDRAAHQEAVAAEADKAMKPEINSGVTPASELPAERADQAAYWLEVIQQEQAAERRDGKSPEQIETEKLMSEIGAFFEEWLATEKLEMLNAIKGEAEAEASPERAAAKLALRETLKRIKVLKELSFDGVDGLMAKHRILSRAVGMINKGLVDHTR